MLFTFEEHLQGKNIRYIVKPCREIIQSFEESLREGKLVYNKLEIF